MTNRMGRRPTHTNQPPRPAVAASRPECSSLVWFESEDLSSELMLSGESGRALLELVRQLGHIDRFLEARVDPPTRILFAGPSGTGKTLAARWLAGKMRRPIAVADVSRIVGSHLGETSSNIGRIFRAAVEGKAVLFLDEIDAICTKREEGESLFDRELARATTTFLQQLDWLATGAPHAVVIAATNFSEELDAALTRRLTTFVQFEAPDRDARLRMLRSWLSHAPVTSEAIERLADESEGLSGAALRARAMEEARFAIMELADKTPPTEPQRQFAEHGQGLLAALEGVAP